MERYFNKSTLCEICGESPAHGELLYCYHDGSVIRTELSCVDCADGYVNQQRMNWERKYDFELFPLRKGSEKSLLPFYPGIGWDHHESQ